MTFINKKIIIASYFAAPYKGNFINSLVELELKLVDMGNSVLYVFPNQVNNCNWFNEFKNNHQCETTGEQRFADFESIVEFFNPDIIHTHFEGYDEASAYAAKRYRVAHNKRIKLIRQSVHDDGCHP